MTPSARPPRACLPQDVAALQVLYGAALRGAPPPLPESVIAAELRALQDHYLPNTRTRVIGPLGAPLGFLSLNGQEIAGLFVRPDAQRGGIGRTLLAWAADQSPVLRAQVFTENQPARRFYAASGFRETGPCTHAETGLPQIQLQRGG